MTDTYQINGEYTLDREFSNEEESKVIEEVLDQLKEQAKTIKFARVLGYRYSCQKYEGGGTILLAVDVEFTLLGRILKKIGVIR